MAAQADPVHARFCFSRFKVTTFLLFKILAQSPTFRRVSGNPCVRVVGMCEGLLLPFCPPCLALPSRPGTWHSPCFCGCSVITQPQHVQGQKTSSPVWRLLRSLCALSSRRATLS